MTQGQFFGHDEGGEGLHVPAADITDLIGSDRYRDAADALIRNESVGKAGAASDNPPRPATRVATALVVPSHPFATLEEILAPTDWGDALRLVTYREDNIRLTVDPASTRQLLLYCPMTGMWRKQEDPHFLPLFDLTLSEANEEALQIAEQDPTVKDRTKGRLRRHIERASGSSVSKALKRSVRLADDPCVRIDRVDPRSLNRVDRYPVILCKQGPVRLDDGTEVDPEDLKGRFLLDMTHAPTAFVPDATKSWADGAVMMRAFLRYLGNGDDTMLCQRLGWQMTGHHQTIDIISGDYAALVLLAQALRDTLGPSGTRIVSMGRGEVRPKMIADAMGQARLCLWTGADTAKRIPVRDLEALVSHDDPRRQGNMLLFVADWPTDWDSLDHRIAGMCVWAWRVQRSLADQGINPEIMLDGDGRGFLLAMLVEGAAHAWRQFEITKENGSGGDSSQVAATDFSRACAEQVRVAGASDLHRILYLALRLTGDHADVMTMKDINKAVQGVGEEPVPHNEIGKRLPKMWPQVKQGKSRVDGEQVRVMAGVTPRVHDVG